MEKRKAGIEEIWKGSGHKLISLAYKWGLRNGCLSFIFIHNISHEKIVGFFASNFLQFQASPHSQPLHLPHVLGRWIQYNTRIATILFGEKILWTMKLIDSTRFCLYKCQLLLEGLMRQ